MPINKVKFGNRNLIDLTGDTVTADNLLRGVKAHDKAGNQIVGTNPGPTAGVTKTVNIIRNGVQEFPADPGTVMNKLIANVNVAGNFSPFDDVKITTFTQADYDDKFQIPLDASYITDNLFCVFVIDKIKRNNVGNKDVVYPFVTAFMKDSVSNTISDGRNLYNTAFTYNGYRDTYTYAQLQIVEQDGQWMITVRNQFVIDKVKAGATYYLIYLYGSI